MKLLQKSSANELLKNVGMQLDEWNRIVDIKRPWNGGSSFSFQAPRDSLEMYCFAQLIADWLPIGSWQLFQIDNSTEFAPDEEFMLARLLDLGSGVPSFKESRSLLFEINSDGCSNTKTRLTISVLIFLFLLFELHGSMVSSNSFEGEILAIQDGFVYFLSRGAQLPSVSKIITEFQSNPLKTPQWVYEKT